MTRIKRPAAALGAAAFLAFSLTACGGGASDAPTDASQDDFCGAWNDVLEPLQTASEGEPSEEQFEEFQDRVADLAEVGTPEGISEEDREGFEAFTDAVADASFDDFKDAGDDIPGVSEEDSKKAESFAEWAFTECTEIPETE